MKSVCYVFISMMLLTVLGPSTVLAKQEAPHPGELMSNWIEVTDIRTQGSPPFQLRGSVEFLHTTWGKLEGTYTLLWMSPKKWRDTLSFPGYIQVRIVKGNTMWRLRKPSYLPYPVHMLEKSLDHEHWLEPRQHGGFSKVKTRKHKGTRKWCFRHRTKNTGGETYCFDANSGVLLSEGNKVESSQYSRYVPWGNKLFPQTISVFSYGTLVAEFDATQLSTLGQPPSGTFSPPPGAGKFRWCDDPVPPKALKESPPPYPSKARDARVTGTVRVLAEVGTDGKAHDAYVAVSPNKIFNTAVLNTISDWTFKPASCQGTPVPVEIEIGVRFRLGP